MKLPNGDHAVVDDEKLLGYVLNMAHPVGRHHAVLFQRLLGIDRDRYLILKKALLVAAKKEEVDRVLDTPYGRKYEMRFKMPGLSIEKTVVAVWIVEDGNDRPRLVTCFVE